MIRPTLINLNLLEVKYYTFRIKTKDKKVNIFNVITNKNDVKAMTKHMSRDCKCKFTVQIKCGITKYVNANVKVLLILQWLHFIEITSVMHIVSRKKTNNIAINLTKIYQSKNSKVSNWLLYLTYISISNHIIIIDNYYYSLSLCKKLVKTKSY